MIEVRLEQLENAPGLIVLKLVGMVIDVRFLHPENALLPIVVTLGGMV